MQDTKNRLKQSMFTEFWKNTKVVQPKKSFFKRHKNVIITAVIFATIVATLGTGIKFFGDIMLDRYVGGGGNNGFPMLEGAVPVLLINSMGSNDMFDPQHYYR